MELVFLQRGLEDELGGLKSITSTSAALSLEKVGFSDLYPAFFLLVLTACALFSHFFVDKAGFVN